MGNKGLKQQIAEVRNKVKDWFTNKTNPREKILILSALIFAIAVPFVKGYERLDELFASQEERLKDIEVKQRALPYRLQSYLQLEAQKSAMESSYKAIHSSDSMRSELEQILQSKSKIRQQTFTITEESQKSEKFAGKYDTLPFKLNFEIMDYSQLIELLYELSVGEKPTIIREIMIQKGSGNYSLRVSIELSGLTQAK